MELLFVHLTDIHIRDMIYCQLFPGCQIVFWQNLKTSDMKMLEP